MNMHAPISVGGIEQRRWSDIDAVRRVRVSVSRSGRPNGLRRALFGHGGIDARKTRLRRYVHDKSFGLKHVVHNLLVDPKTLGAELLLVIGAVYSCVNLNLSGKVFLGSLEGALSISLSLLMFLFLVKRALFSPELQFVGNTLIASNGDRKVTVNLADVKSVRLERSLLESCLGLARVILIGRGSPVVIRGLSQAQAQDIESTCAVRVRRWTSYSF